MGTLFARRALPASVDRALDVKICIQFIVCLFLIGGFGFFHICIVVAQLHYWYMNKDCSGFWL